MLYTTTSAPIVKGRQPVGEGPNDRGASRLHLMRALEASLRRLRIEPPEFPDFREYAAEIEKHRRFLPTKAHKILGIRSIGHKAYYAAGTAHSLLETEGK